MGQSFHSCRQWLIAFVAASTIVLLAIGQECKAGIISPAPIGFDDKDLDRELASSKSNCGAAAPKNSEQSPLEDGDQNHNPSSDHLNTAIPLNQSSSSSSSSSTGGPAGSGAAFCTLSTTTANADDSLLGRLPEDQALSVPNPPGTDLLRPPRA
jgi:hypothetical protein